MKRRLLGLLAAWGILLSLGCSTARLPDQMRIGLWAAQQRLWDEAIFRWKRYLETNPNSAAAHNNLAVAYETQGRWDEARKEYEAALKLDPKNFRVEYNFDQLKKNTKPKESPKREPEKKTADEKKD